jgi:hypothetical protein
MIGPDAKRQRYEVVARHLNEKGLRIFAARGARTTRKTVTGLTIASGINASEYPKGQNISNDLQSGDILFAQNGITPSVASRPFPADREFHLDVKRLFRSGPLES